MHPFFEPNMSYHDYQEKLRSLSPDEKKQVQSYIDKMTDEIMDRVPDFIPADKIKREYNGQFCLSYNDNCLGRYRTSDYKADFSYILFRKSFHPFFGEMAERESMIELLLRYLTDDKPYSFTVYKDRLTVRFDSRYQTYYGETHDEVLYNQSYQDSWHDGAGSEHRTIAFSHTQFVDIPHRTIRGKEINGLELPVNNGFRLENDGHLYIDSPFGMPGVFELYIRDEYQSDAFSDTIIKTVGIEPPVRKK